MLCERHGCLAPVGAFLLSGCLKMHIQERYYCWQHMADYVSLIRVGIVCERCVHGRIAEYLVHTIA